MITKAQVTLTGAKIAAASGAIVQETGTATLEFAPSGITYATGDVITIVLASGSSIATTTPTCTPQLSQFSVSACTYTSATRTLQITMSSPVASPTYIIVDIGSFVYPTSSLNFWPATGGAEVTVTSSGGTSKGVATDVKITGVSSGSITSITINHDSSNPTVGASGATLFFSVTVPHQVPTTGTMTIYFPPQPVSGNNVVSSPTCTQSGGTMSGSLSCSYSTSNQILTLSNMLTTAKSGEFNFTVSGITNPISLAPVTGILVKTFASSGGTIDTGSGSWSVPTAATLTGVTWGLSGSTQVSTLSSMQFFYSLPFPVEANSVIEFTFPSDITVSSSLTSYTGKGIFVSGTSFTTKTSSVVKVSGSTTSVAATTTSFIIFSSIMTPNKIKETGSMTITMSTSSGHQIATVSSGVTLATTSLTSGSTNVNSVTPTSTIVQTSTVSYAFVFNPGKLRY